MYSNPVVSFACNVCWREPSWEQNNVPVCVWCKLWGSRGLSPKHAVVTVMVCLWFGWCDEWPSPGEGKQGRTISFFPPALFDWSIDSSGQIVHIEACAIKSKNKREDAETSNVLGTQSCSFTSNGKYSDSVVKTLYQTTARLETQFLDHRLVLTHYSTNNLVFIVLQLFRTQFFVWRKWMSKTCVKC